MAAAARAPRNGRLLVVTPNWLGDLVMAMPALARLSAAREDGWSITLVVPRRWAPLLEDDHRFAAIVPGERGRLAGVARQVGAWRATGAEAVVLMPPSLRVALVAWLAGIPVRVGQRSDGRSLLLTHPVARPRRGTFHYEDEMLAIAAAWERTVGRAPPGDDARSPQTQLPGCARFAPDARLASGPVTWALGAGATFGDAKSWPPRHLAAFAERATREEGVRLLLLGDAGARPAADAVRAGAAVPCRDAPQGGSGVVDLVGRTSLPELVGLLRACALYIGNDSGLMHLAAALGVPTLGLFGATSPAWTAPRGPRTAVVTADGFACAPCYRRHCPLPACCLDTITADAVLASARLLLASPARNGAP